MRRASSAALCAASAAVVAWATSRDAGAQRLDPRRPTTFVVGAPPGASPMQRVDGRRSGAAKAPLPAGKLRVAWRKPTGLTLDQPALSGADGTLAIVSVRGDVTFIDVDGEERATVKGGAAQGGPAVMTSDGTVVYMTSAGDAVGVRRGGPRPRFTSRVGGERNVRAAPLALDDGGVVLATTGELVALDSEGNVRWRTSLPEPPAAPLVAAQGEILAVTSSGAVFGWAFGREPVRIGSFGAPIDGGAALTERGSLLAVVQGHPLVEIDVTTRGGGGARSHFAQGLYLGPPTVRTGPDGASTVTLLALTPTRGFVVTLDPSGQELSRATIASFAPTVLPDGGAPPIVAPPIVGPLVDARGAVAFAAPDGRIGVVSPDGVVETVGEALCASGARSGVVGLTPFGAGAFAVTCDSGIVARITGDEPIRRP